MIGSSTHPENKPDKNGHETMLKSITFEMSLLDQLRMAERSSRSSPKRQKLFSNTVLISPPFTTQSVRLFFYFLLLLLLLLLLLFINFIIFIVIILLLLLLLLLFLFINIMILLN